MADSTRRDKALRWRNLKTGIVFLIGMIVVGWLAFFIGRNSGLITAHHLVYVFSPDSKGLQEGNFVGISGKKVGTVKSIDLQQQHDSNGVLITLDIIGDDYFRIIPRDSKATIKGMGILGDKIVDIQLGRSSQLLQDGDQLQLQFEPGMEDLTANAIQTMKNMNELTDKINKGQGTLGQLITSDSISRKINLTLANLNTVTAKLSSGKGIVPQLLNDGTLADQVRQTSKDLSEITGKIKQGNGAFGKFLLGDDFLSHLDRVSVHADSLVALLNNPNGTLAKISQDPALYNNMNTSIEAAHRAIFSLDSLLTDFKKNPGRYVKVSVF
jgi:phospholipid/cholesterol/gamma-HCH transport system substrate-binding protein